MTQNIKTTCTGRIRDLQGRISAFIEANKQDLIDCDLADVFAEHISELQYEIDLSDEMDSEAAFYGDEDRRERLGV